MDLEQGKTFRAVFDGLPFGIQVVDLSLKTLLWSAGAEKITGYHGFEMVGRNCEDNLLRHCDENGTMVCGSNCPMAAVARTGLARETRLFLHHKAGHRVPVVVKISPLRNEGGEIVGVVQAFEPRVAKDVSVSGVLPRRTYAADPWPPSDRENGFPVLLERLLERKAQFGVLCIRLENVRDFQATHGQEATAVILRVVADTIRNALRGMDWVEPWHDDAFMAVLLDCDEVGLEKTGERVRRLVSGAGIQWWGDWVAASVSVGGALAQPGDKAEAIVRRAEDSLTRELSETTDIPKFIDEKQKE